MSSKNLSFKCAIVTGGYSGLGRAFSEYLLSIGKKVIIVGRTQSSLDTAMKELKPTAGYLLDTGNIASIPSFVQKVTQEHPDVDCVINNAGVQRPIDVEEQSVEDYLQKADEEIDINIRGPLHLVLHLLPHFKTQPNGAVVMNVSSVLGYIPVSIINPDYNGTKAWLHFWSMNLRTQLKNTKVRVVEIVPPAVTTALHRERKDPKDNTKEKNAQALSVEDFMREVVDGLKKDQDVVSAGPGVKIVERWHKEFLPDYEASAAKWKA